MLSDYQLKVVDQVDNAWCAGKMAPMIVMATGSGKTRTFCHVVSELKRPSLVMAHRQELLSQMSVTLGRYGIRHRILAPATTRRMIEADHMREFGRRWIDHNAMCAVGSVQSLVRYNDDFLSRVELCVPDEAHHVLRNNMWGHVIGEKLPSKVKLLMPTATPTRSDGKGLGVEAHGLADTMILGPTMRESILDGYLCDYRVFSPLTRNLDLSQVSITASGEYSPPQLDAAVGKSSITGDVVLSYLRFAAGKKGITFAVNVLRARELAKEFIRFGIPAAVLTAESTSTYRAEIMRKYARAEILQLVNVDILGEGVDCPACEVISFARPTASLSLYIQQFGRVLRPIENTHSEPGRAARLAKIANSIKPHGLVIDHVGNVHDRHRLPDTARQWTLAARSGTAKKQSELAKGVPLRKCLNPKIIGGCLAEYERTKPQCPVCNYVPVPVSRSTPAEVDGDLIELSPEVLAALRGEAARIMSDDAPKIPYGASPAVAGAIHKRHRQRKEAQIKLGESIAYWRGWLPEMTDSEAYKRFYWTYGVDVATARTLGRAEAEELTMKINVDTGCNSAIFPLSETFNNNNQEGEKMEQDNIETEYAEEWDLDLTKACNIDDTECESCQ